MKISILPVNSSVSNKQAVPLFACTQALSSPLFTSTRPVRRPLNILCKTEGHAPSRPCLSEFVARDASSARQQCCCESALTVGYKMLEVGMPALGHFFLTGS